MIKFLFRASLSVRVEMSSQSEREGGDQVMMTEKSDCIYMTRLV